MAKRVVKKKVETKKRRSPSRKKLSKKNTPKTTKKSIMGILFKLLVSINIALLLHFGYLTYFKPKNEEVTSIKEKMNRKSTTNIEDKQENNISSPVIEDVNTKKESKPTTSKRVLKKSSPKKIKEKVTFEATKYLGMKYKLGGDPAKGDGIDNSHLMHAIISQSEKELNNGISNFKYKTMAELIKDSYEISLSQLSNGDLIVLKDGMIGMIIDEENRDGYSVIYVSGSQKKVVKVESSKLGQYWLKSKNKKGYYRLNYLGNK